MSESEGQNELGRKKKKHQVENEGIWFGLEWKFNPALGLQGRG